MLSSLYVGFGHAEALRILLSIFDNPDWGGGQYPNLVALKSNQRKTKAILRGPIPEKRSRAIWVLSSPLPTGTPAGCVAGLQHCLGIIAAELGKKRSILARETRGPFENRSFCGQTTSRPPAGPSLVVCVGV